MYYLNVLYSVLISFETYNLNLHIFFISSPLKSQELKVICGIEGFFIIIFKFGVTHNLLNITRNR